MATDMKATKMVIDEQAVKPSDTEFGAQPSKKEEVDNRRVTSSKYGETRQE